MEAYCLGWLLPRSDNVILSLKVNRLSALCRTACIPGRSGRSCSAGRLRRPKRAITANNMDGSDYKRLERKWQCAATANGAVIPDVAPRGATSCTHGYFPVHDASTVRKLLPEPAVLVTALDNLLGYRKLKQSFNLGYLGVVDVFT